MADFYKYVLSLGVFAVLLSFTKTDPKRDLDAKLSVLKTECKELIKPARYEGSRTIYFTVRKKSQKKSIELSLVPDNEYVFGVSGKECSRPVIVRFYDLEDESKRTLIAEQAEINGKNHFFSVNELNAAYKQKLPEAQKLEQIFIEYEIAAGEEQLEGIVLVIGNKEPKHG